MEGEEMSDERDVLAGLIDPDANDPDIDWPDSMLGQAVSRKSRSLRIADAILAAGWRPPAQDEPSEAEVEAAARALFYTGMSQHHHWPGDPAAPLPMSLRVGSTDEVTSELPPGYAERFRGNAREALRAAREARAALNPQEPT
jgi:hypothetical protein